MNWYAMTDQGILRELVNRIRKKRLMLNLTQKELALKAGIHFNSVVRLEHGKTISLMTFIQVLRVLDELDGLNMFLPDPGISPIQLLKLKGKEKMRASKTRTVQDLRK
jgi:transcriptional regulator with XRE-family HTH domain